MGERSDLALARLSEHLLHLADRLIKAAGALPDGEPWVEVSAVAMELTRLGRLFSAAQSDGDGRPSVPSRPQP